MPPVEDVSHVTAPDARAMGDGAGRGASASASGRKKKFFLVPELFLVPLLVVTVLVTVMVLVYVFFAAAAEEGRSIGKLISDLKVAGVLDRQTPTRAAHSLAILAAGMEERGVKLDEKETRALIEVFEQSRANPAIHRYVVLALGRVGREDLVLPLLESVLADADSEPGARIEAVRGLGLSRSLKAVGPLEASLKSCERTEDWEMRAGILQALTNIAEGPQASGRAEDRPVREEIAGTLRRYLDDRSPIVARNVAMWLAEDFHDSSGVATLRRLLDWEYLESQKLTPEEQALYLCRAIECLTKLGDEDSLPKIREHARENRNYKVKNAALRALSSPPRPPRGGGGASPCPG
jgi:HEAT repeat protein